MENTNIFAEGGVVTLLGLLVVFVCLALIIVVILIMAWILKDRKKPETKTEQKIEEAIHEPLPEVPEVVVQNDPLIAVLTAAVTAYMMDEEATASSGLVVRSYKRPAGAGQWARAGRNAQIYNKF